MNQAMRIGDVPLAVQVLHQPPYVVGRWIGSGVESAREVASRAAGELLARPAEHLILDLARLTDVSEGVAGALARCLSEAQRGGRSVCLVRCSEQLYRTVQGAGLAGGVAHAGSLHAATQGLVGEPTGILDLHIRSEPAMLGRLREVVSVVAQEAGLREQTELQVMTALNEAVGNAIRHGSPEGPRNHVRVSLHLGGGALIIDVADQGRGFDAGTEAPGESAEEEAVPPFGLLMMRRSMDRVEFYRDDRGMLVRMTRFLSSGEGCGAQ